MKLISPLLLVFSYTLDFALSQSSVSLPFVNGAQGANCLQTRAPSDPAGSVISGLIAQNLTVNKACNSSSATIDTASLTSFYVANGDYTFNYSFPAGSSGLPNTTTCVLAFNTILSQCVDNGNFWGGWQTNSGSNFSSEATYETRLQC